MRTFAGVWIDHEKAVVVTGNGEELTTSTFLSGVPGRPRLAGGSRSRAPYGPMDVASESRRDERHRQQLVRFYRRVAAGIADAERIYVFGPGEAKLEFRKLLQRSKETARRIVAVGPADKMTLAQITAHVRTFFRARERVS